MPIDSLRFSYQQKQERKKKSLIFILSLFVTLLVVNIFLLFIIKSFWVNSDSMSPEFSGINAVFVIPFSEGKSVFLKQDSFNRGSIVTINNNSVREKNAIQKVVDFACGMFTFQRIRPFEKERWGESELFRIVGMPGDTLYIDNYIAKIKPQGADYFLTEFELTDIDYTIISDGFPKNWSKTMGVQGKTKEITLKQAEYFLLSDNRVVSIDSRIFGAVSVNNISGKAILQYYPFQDFRVLK